MAHKNDQSGTPPEPPQDPAPETPSEPEEITLRPAGEVEVEHKESAPPAPREKQIHPRRPLPRVPESKPKQPGERQDTERSD